MKKNKSICLNMIVKNEEKVIERCLCSVKPWIDYWVISDTGSTDRTKEVIRACLQGIPGELMERPWVDFSYNRNEVLFQAKGKGDFALFIDADEWLDIAPTFAMPDLSKDCYVASVKVPSGAVYQRVLLINNNLRWEWRGVLHEDVCPIDKFNGYEFLKGVLNVSNTSDGHRSSNPKKYQKDAAVLKAALDKEPDNCRYAYYLAQSYEEGQDWDLALETFAKRTQMTGGWAEEVFYSYYKIANLQRRLNYPPHIFIDSYCRAYQDRPTRAEPLFHLADYYYSTNNPLPAYLLLQHALTIPRCTDCMLVEHPLYDYAILLHFGAAAATLGQFHEAYEAYQKLLHSSQTPLPVKQWVTHQMPAIAAKRMASCL